MKKSNIFTVLALGVLAIGAGAAVAFNSGAETIEPAAALAEPTEEKYILNVKTTAFKDRPGSWKKVSLYLFENTDNKDFETYPYLKDTNFNAAKPLDGENIVSFDITKYIAELNVSKVQIRYYNGDGTIPQNNQTEYQVLDTLKAGYTNTYVIDSWGGSYGQLKGHWDVPRDINKQSYNTGTIFFDRVGQFENSTSLLQIKGDNFSKVYGTNVYTEMKFNNPSNDWTRWFATYAIPVDELAKAKTMSLISYNDDGSAYFSNEIQIGEKINLAKVLRFDTNNGNGSFNVKFENGLIPGEKIYATTLCNVLDKFVTCSPDLNGYKQINNIIESWFGPTSQDGKYIDIIGNLSDTTFKDYDDFSVKNPSYDKVARNRETSVEAKVLAMQNMNSAPAGVYGILGIDEEQTITIIVITSIVAITGIALVAFILSKKKRLAK